MRNYLMLAVTFLTGVAFVVYSSNTASMSSESHEYHRESFEANDAEIYDYDVDSFYLDSEYLEDIGEAIYYEDMDYDFGDIFEELQEGNGYAALESKLKKYISKYNCQFGIYFVDLESGSEFGINAEEEYFAASTFKIPLNLYVYDRIREGIIDADTTLEYAEEDYEGGAGIIWSRESYGKTYTVRELLRLSIVYSDNVAVNMLLRYVGKENVKNYMREMGGIVVDDKKNLSCPRDMALYLKKVYELSENGDPLGKELVRNMVNTKFYDRLPVLLPKNVKIAHKTGNLIGVVHDVGIVYAKRPYIIVVMTKNVKNERSANKAIANISKITYDYVMTQSERVDD